VFIYDGVAKDIIAGYKFGRRLALLPLLAQYLAVELGRWGAPPVVPVVPVPASPAGRRRRGFDQVALLSRELARRHAVVVCHALTRRRGREQKRLDVAGRSRNLVGAVRVQPAVLAERPGRVILLDDVFTTGATIHECARVLRSAGVSAVDALTLAAD
jgi:ComF family protein